jgi:hypothetical protein
MAQRYSKQEWRYSSVIVGGWRALRFQHQRNRKGAISATATRFDEYCSSLSNRNAEISRGKTVKQVEEGRADP